ncbi:MAG: Ig-like domain-containing protein [Thermodesulfobacteriota bacterium]|nr:Ig-like domain-containing protein [Thermodesulfobacteriota bacterium]
MSTFFTNRSRLLGWSIMVFILLSAARSYGWPCSGESNLFDLSPCHTDAYFAAESNIFSLNGEEQTYSLNLSASYSIEQQAARILVYAYDTVSGSLVSTGQGSYRISQGNQVIVSKSLFYSDSARVWDSGNVAMAGAGEFLVGATINGQSVYKTVFIGSPSIVHLTGTARDDDGNPIGGVTIKLYNASTILGIADIYNLPLPLAIVTTLDNGEFDFGSLPNGQYILILQTDDGITIGQVFWLRDSEETHPEIIVENPGRTELLGSLLGLRESIQENVVNKQTEWMMDVAKTVDGDLDASPDLVDWCLLAGNIVSETAASFGMAWIAGLSPSHFGDIAGQVTVDSLTNQGLILAGTITAVESASLNNQALAAKGALAQPYFAYGETAIEELTEIDSVLSTDIKLLLDPKLHTPILEMAFRRDDPMHRHSKDWFKNLGSYSFANDRLNTYYASAVKNFPNLPENFSINKAEAILTAADNQLKALGSGTGLIFVSPNPEEYSSTDATFESLALNLADFYQKYQVGRSKKEIADWIKKGSSVVSIGGHTVAAASAAGVVSAPGAAVAETVALAASAVSFGTGVIQAGIKADMAGTYVNMSSKYCANLLTAPLVLKRTEAFVISETTDPYYLNPSNSFGGAIENVTLGSLNIGGREVFFPIQLTLLPFCPPIQLTSTKLATVDFGNPAGENSPAVYRIESKVLDSSGAHDHVVTNGGELYAGQTTQVQIPFQGHLMANRLLSAGTLEARLWVGPFQSPSEHCVITRDFIVMPINIGGLPGPLGEGQDIELGMKKPLHFVRTKEQFLSGEDIIGMADRVRERYEATLTVGSNVIERNYTFSNDIFESEFRLYRPLGTKVSFFVEKDGGYIGWDPITETVHYGFPGDYSGKDANPESYVVPNCGGETINVRVELGDVITDPVNLLLEVWERPKRDAVMAVLPDSISIVAETGGIQTAEIAVGESSHQKPLQDITLSLSELKNETGNSLPWSSVKSFDTNNVMAGGVRTYHIEINTKNAFGGTYTGTVSVGSSNAGTVEVPVEVTVEITAVDDVYTTSKQQTLNVAAPGVLANDESTNGSTLSAIKVSDPAHGTLTLNADGSFIYIPDDNFNGVDSFTYKVNDGIADSNVATVTINVLGEIVPGDIDGSGTVDLRDAILALKVSVGISGGDVYPDRDINEDGKIGREEVIYILQKVSGLRQ